MVCAVLLRRLTSHWPGHQVHKAFADDVGIVLEDAGKQLDALVSILDAFGAIVGMKVNISKTVGIQLWPGPLADASRFIAGAAPRWAALPFCSNAIYLVCMIGPAKKGIEWDKALTKLKGRIREWPWSSLGLHFATTGVQHVCNICLGIYSADSAHI